MYFLNELLMSLRNKYHDVLHHTAHALSRMLSYLDFRLDWRKTIHYTTSGLIFLKYLNREKISVFKNIRILVHGGDFGKNKILLVWGNRPYPLTSWSRTALSYLLLLPVGSLAKEVSLYSTCYQHSWNFPLNNVTTCVPYALYN